MSSLCNYKQKWQQKAMIQLFVLLLTSLAHICAGLECLHCDGVLDPGHCNTFKTCDEHEVCYIDNLERPDGQKIFNLGCRDNKFCPAGYESLESLGHLLHDGFGHRNYTHGTQTLLCSECCYQSLCNIRGCGQPGIKAIQDGSRLICAKCDQHNSTNDCDKFTLCGHNQVCRMDRVAIEWAESHGHYVSGCEDSKECIYKMNMYEHSYGHTDRNCDIVCCSGHLCNTKCNETFSPHTTQTLMTSSTHKPTTQTMLTTQQTTPDPCGTNPCRHGHCSVRGGSYVCSCSTGYMGQHCDYACRYLHYTTMYYNTHHDYVKYAIVKKYMTYSEAEQYCRSHCGQLLQVLTADKLHYFQHFLSHQSGMAHTYWINGQMNSNNEWKTSTGQNLPDDLWASDPSTHTTRKCASIEDDADYRLMNYYCGGHHYIICEKL